jgi:HEAT repeat protein
MVSRKGKWCALAAGVLGVAVLAAAAFALKDRALEQYWMWKLRSRDPEARVRAATALGAARSVAAVPLLMEAFEKDPGTSEGLSAYGEALARIGAPAVEALLDVMGAGDDLVRGHVSAVFLAMEPEDLGLFLRGRYALGGRKPATEAKVLMLDARILGQCLRGGRAETRRAAAWALGLKFRDMRRSLEEQESGRNRVLGSAASPRSYSQTGPGSWGPMSAFAYWVAPALEAGLRDADPGVREEAALSLGYLAGGAVWALPALESLVRDESAAVREAAEYSVERISREAPSE